MQEGAVILPGAGWQAPRDGMVQPGGAEEMAAVRVRGLRGVCGLPGGSVGVAAPGVGDWERGHRGIKSICARVCGVWGVGWRRGRLLTGSCQSDQGPGTREYRMSRCRDSVLGCRERGWENSWEHGPPAREEGCRGTVCCGLVPASPMRWRVSRALTHSLPLPAWPGQPIPPPQCLQSPVLEVGKTAAMATAKIAAIDLPRGEWPGLIPALLQNMGAQPPVTATRTATLKAMGEPRAAASWVPVPCGFPVML